MADEKLHSLLSHRLFATSCSEMRITMAIIINLDVMMAMRKKGLTELAGEIDITLANLSILKNNKAKAIRLSTLNEICKALNCQPGDLLQYVEDEDSPTEEKET